MRRWDLTSLPPSTQKRTPREPGADAPRVATDESDIPRVLLTSPECRAVVVDLPAGAGLGEHRVRERALVHVVDGRVVVMAGGEEVECGEGTLVAFEPSEPHRLQAVTDARLLLVLAPWPAERHYADDASQSHAQELPANAAVQPLPADDAP
jgi:quercetin dioxygenase-like cupin family protein